MKFLKAFLFMSFAGSVASAATYGDAGCGLGSIVFGEQKGFVQVFAATTNGTSGSQTFGMSTGTSNCGPSVFSSAETKAFIDNNAVALENDVVRGQGETLGTLSKLMNCDQTVLSSALKSNYQEIYSAKENSSQKIMSTAEQACSAQI